MLIKQIQLEQGNLISCPDIDMKISVLTLEDLKKWATSLAYSKYKDLKWERAI